MSDFDRAVKAVEKRHFEKAAGIAIKPSFRAAANLVRKNTRAELKPHRRTGKMRDRIKYRFKGMGLNLQAIVRSTGAQSNMIVGGTKPHQITAGGKVMPLWMGKSGKGDIVGITGFAAVVEHPGTRADPFFHRGVQKSMPGIDRFFQQAADSMVQLLAHDMEGR